MVRKSSSFAIVVDVEERLLYLPNCPWPQDRKMKDLGRYHLQNTLEGLGAVGWKFLKLAGYAPEEIEVIVKDTENFIRDVRYKPYTPV